MECYLGELEPQGRWLLSIIASNPKTYGGGRGKKAVEFCLIWKYATSFVKVYRVLLQEATCPGPLPLDQMCLMGTMRKKRNSRKGLPLAWHCTVLIFFFFPCEGQWHSSTHCLVTFHLSTSWCNRNALALQLGNLQFIGTQPLSHHVCPSEACGLAFQGP